MTRERILRIMAGAIILISLYLDGTISTEVSWLWLTAFVGLNLLQSGFTNFCPPEMLMKKFNIGKPCNPNA
ncbi:MAG: YgaP family membrane protein [Gammaproteobacteria bacterium]